MLNTFRFILLLICLLAGVTAGAWTFLEEDVLPRLDAKAKRNYMRSSGRVPQARALIQQEKVEEGLALLEEFIEDQRGIQIGDRFERPYRSAVTMQVETLIDLNRTEEAINAARKFQAYAPRDLKNQLTLGRILCQAEATRDEGMGILRSVFGLAPEWAAGADALIIELLRDGDWEAAVDVGVKFVRRARWVQTKMWRVFWDAGKGLVGNPSMEWHDLSWTGGDSRYRLQQTIPATEGRLNSLRFDAPESVALRLKDWRVIVRTEEGERELTDPALVVENSSLAPDESGALISRGEGKSSRVKLQIPDPPNIAGGAHVILEARVETIMPLPLRKFLSTDTHTEDALRWLEGQERIEDAALLRWSLGLEEDRS